MSDEHKPRQRQPLTERKAEILTDTVRDLLSRFTLLEIIEEIQRQSPQ